MLELNKIYNMDCLEGMKKLDDNSIDLIITSPPYDNLRDYTKESDWNFDIFKNIANELFRVIKEGSVVVWIVGDATINGSETGSSFRQALYFKEIGFKLHDTMIFQKHNFSKPSINRYHQIFEYMFVFVKGKLKTFNKIKDIKSKYAFTYNYGKNSIRQKDGSFKIIPNKKHNKYIMRTNIWKYQVGYIMGKDKELQKLIFKHPATYPLNLAKDHIISWSNMNDIVLDPFMGSGTTAVACKELQRNFIGFEISKKYCDIAEERLDKWKGQKRLF